MEKRIELEKRGKNPADVSIFHIFVVIVRRFKVSSFIMHVLDTFSPIVYLIHPNFGANLTVILISPLFFYVQRIL